MTATTSKPFRIALHPRPPGLEHGQPVVIDGRTITPLDVQPHQLSQPFPVTFDDACERLAKLPRLFCEPDGSFVWVADDPQQPWQLDGNLYDSPGGLMYVELSGTIILNKFDDLLRCVGWPDMPVVVQLVREAVFLDEDEWRRAWWSQGVLGSL
jgi:hypothetical protein